MKFTLSGRDVISLTDETLKDCKIPSDQKIHLIKIDITSPSPKAIEAITMMFPNTNRYIISANSNIKVFNDTFKRLTKKYYVENETNSRLVSFLRKNNKVLLNVAKLSPHDYTFVDNESVLVDLLWNVEVMSVPIKFYESWKPLFTNWPGNLILS